MIWIRGLLVAGVLAISSTASAGAWTPAPNHGYSKFWVKWHWGWGFVDGDGGRHRIGNYHDVTFATYGDLGIAPGLAVFWHSDLVRFYSLEDSRDDSANLHISPGDPALGFRWQFVRGDRLAMSLELGARAPIADAEPVQVVYARNDPHEAVGALQVGDGAWSVRPVLSFGYAFDSVYLGSSVSYQYRARGYDDRLAWSAEVGMTFNERSGGRLRASGSYSLFNGTAERSNSPNGRGNGSSWTGLAVELDYRLTGKWYAGVTIEGGLGAIRRLSGGPVISLSVATQY